MSSSDNNNKNAFPVRGAGFISQDDSFLHVAIALDSTNNVRDDHVVFVDDQPEIASGSIADEKVVEKAQCRPQRWKVLATVLVIGIIVIIIAIVTTKGKQPADPSPTSSPKSSPTSSPSSSPTSFSLLNFLDENSFDYGAALSTGDSSQQKALKWLESTAYNGVSKYTLLQFYALEVINFATGNTRPDLPSYIVCEESYISCNGNNYITRLGPFSMKIAGSIPPEIGLLTSLTALNLSNNALVGTLPSEIGRLTSLIALNLFNNAFAGTLPSEIGLLTSLTYLDLLNNDFAGTLPSEIGLLTSLTYLDLSSNFFTGGPYEILDASGNSCDPTSGPCGTAPS